MARTAQAISNVRYAQNSCEAHTIAKPSVGALQPPETSSYAAVGTSTTASRRPMPEGDGIAMDSRKR